MQPPPIMHQTKADLHLATIQLTVTKYVLQACAGKSFLKSLVVTWVFTFYLLTLDFIYKNKILKLTSMSISNSTRLVNSSGLVSDDLKQAANRS